ncbi:MAG: site-2 protease family protein [Patescibacteria group bacterium]
MIHEIAHGFMAEKLGDDTAKLAGRLTLNPLRHIDLFGSILLPLVLFLTHSPIMIGWAKPVPFNPFALKKDYRYGPLKVALAGPLSNVLILLVVGILARLGFGFFSPELIGLLGYIAFLNISLAVFNLIPIPPLDGSRILPLIFPKLASQFERIGMAGILLVVVFLSFFSSVIVTIAAYIFVFVAGSNVFVTSLPYLSGQ